MITLVITSINQPMHIMMPSTTLIFVLPGTGATRHADAEHDGHAHGQADRDRHPDHGGDADAGDDQHGCDQHSDPGPDRSRSHPLVT